MGHHGVKDLSSLVIRSLHRLNLGQLCLKAIDGLELLLNSLLLGEGGQLVLFYHDLSPTALGSDFAEVGSGATSL